MSLYGDHILPRCLDFGLSRPHFNVARERITQGLVGEVVEIGFGSGLNLAYYPNTVTKIHAVDPAEVGRRLARKRLRACKIPVAWSGLDGQRLTLPAQSMDAALCTFTLCTIPDAVRALQEVRRVLKPGAALHFLEHGRSPETSVNKWQNRLTPIQRVVVGGCHFNRAIADLIRAAGFCLDALDNYYLPGPKFATYMYEGRARACSPACAQA
jgi:ubiquinone/menaquinone biosynthesis C-methylase UbiE